MGQKINPILYRIGKSKKWEHVFNEKKKFDFSKHTENFLEIQDFVFEFFKKNNLIVCENKIFSTDGCLYIFVKYLPSRSFFFQG